MNALRTCAAAQRLSAVLAGGLLTFVPQAVLADCGSIPFDAPFGRPVEAAKNELKLDPLKVSVFEPKQRAIILWNGEEEVLLLSTDQKATAKAHVLEVIPLPSQPTVRLGSFKTFETAQKLVVEKRMWAVAHGGARAGVLSVPSSAGRIAFAQKMGAHDLAVAEVIDTGRFVEFVQDYLRERYRTADALIRPDLVKIVESYIDKGSRWFAFDVIHMDNNVKSREPIEYRFRSDRVFYPLRISSLEQGRTEAELLVFTSSGVTKFDELPGSEIARRPAIRFSRDELKQVDSAWIDFFPATVTEVAVDQWKIEGRSADLKRDVAAR